MQILYFALIGTALAVFLNLPLLGLIVAAVMVAWIVFKWWPHRNDPIDPRDIC